MAYFGNMYATFGNWDALNYNELVFNIIFISLFSIMLGVSILMKNKNRNYFILGFLFLFVSRIIELPAKKYVESIATPVMIFSLPILCFLFLGYLFLIRAFFMGENKK